MYVSLCVCACVCVCVCVCVCIQCVAVTTLSLFELCMAYRQGETLEVPVNPGGTAIFYYQFLSGDPLEQVLFQLSDESASRGVCAIIHVQDSTV